jgi:16S rRNA processing protein RimM
MQDENKRILMGRIAGIYGVKGWLKIVSYTRPPENIFLYTPWLIKKKGEWQETGLQEGRIHGKGLIASLAGITGRDAAREYIGADIEIYRSQLQKLPPGEYYQDDLLGLQVINRQGAMLGNLKEILETGANEVLVIEGQGRHLIPLIWDMYVTSVDLAKGIIEVDWEPEA